jgi:hypothetical protein
MGSQTTDGGIAVSGEKGITCRKGVGWSSLQCTSFNLNPPEILWPNQLAAVTCSQILFRSTGPLAASASAA